MSVDSHQGRLRLFPILTILILMFVNQDVRRNSYQVRQSFRLTIERMVGFFRPLVLGLILTRRAHNLRDLCFVQRATLPRLCRNHWVFS